jgi:hypothetical protein
VDRRQDEEEAGRRNQGKAADEEWTPRPEPEQQQPAGDEARAFRGDDRAERRRTAQIPLRHERAEDAEGAHPDHVPQRRRDDHDPQPGPRPELVPAFRELPKERLGRRFERASDAHAEEEGRAGGIRRRVERDRPARPDRRYRHASYGRADDVAPALRESQKRVSLLEQVRFHRLRHDRDRGREEESDRGPARDLEHDEVPDLGATGQQEQRGCSLRTAAEHVRADHHEVARDAVADDAANENEDDLGQPRARQHVAEVGRRAGEVEHGEREGDRRDGRAEQ